MKKSFLMTVAATLFVTTGAAHADSITQKENFEFQLTRVLVDQVLPINIEDYDAVWAGQTTKKFEQFNPGLGTLVKAKLEVEMNIDGEIFIQNVPFAQTQALEVDTLIGEVESVEIIGKAETGPLTAPIDFGEYNLGEDGIIEDDFLIIDAFGEGMDMTSNPLDLDFFIGNDLIDALIAACVMINYFDQQIGGREVLDATGEVRLIYEFKGDKPVIPTPAAFAAGLSLLGGLALRRRRAC